MTVVAFAGLCVLALLLFALADARDDRRLALWAGVALALAGLLAVCSPAPAAPAPFRPRPDHALTPGTGTMTWRGRDCFVNFCSDGDYFCFWDHRWWNGRWACKGGVLTVTEWPHDERHAVSSWEVRLKCPRSGVMGGTPWRARPWAGRVD